MKFKYKVGDKVKIRKDLRSEEGYGFTKANPYMARRKGTVMEVTERLTERNYPRYQLNNNDYCVWTECMFEGKETELSKLKRTKLVKEIIKEISSNKAFMSCFKNLKDMKKEVKAWDDNKLINWNK